MNVLSNFTYLESIAPTINYATAIQRLTFQDVKNGGFPYPISIADPNSYEKVAIQELRLYRYPERYSGYLHQGQLVAYMKQADWTLRDDLPFSGLATRLNQRIQIWRNGNLSTGDWGVFGLVVDEKQSRPVREEIFFELLNQAILRAKRLGCSKVNIVMSPNDPALGTVAFLGFTPVGRWGEVAGLEGKKQRRYQLTIDTMR